MRSELLGDAAAVQDDVPGGGEAAEEADLAQERRILDGRARALRSEARDRLRVTAVDEGREREQLGGRDDALSAAPGEAHLKHG
jgi:hypothetical protein